jgi:hypothetical protein
MYGDRAAEVIDALYTHPSAVLPVILKRLRQRNQAWTQVKKEIQKSVYPPLTQSVPPQSQNANAPVQLPEPKAQSEAEILPQVQPQPQLA